MNCPRCNKWGAEFHEAGYARATAVAGGAAPVEGHISCRLCGFYKEVVDVALPMSQDMIMKVQQPLSNKTIVGPTVHGEIKELVRREWGNITALRNAAHSWDYIYAQIALLAPPGVTLTRQALINAYHRINSSKARNVRDKAVRADKARAPA